MLRFSGCASGAACSIVLRGASGHLLDEAERSLHDALCVLLQTVKETRTINGGGCGEMLMAQAVEAKVPEQVGKKVLAMEAFARALRQMPTIIADNTGAVGDMVALGIRESYKSKLVVVTSAAEAAEMILRVDDIVKCAPRQRQ